MNYFTPGLAEFSRIFRRTLDGVLLGQARRNLAVAETQLGLLGWQQAEFDPNTQREVDKIQNYEREQARLSNVSAVLGRKVQELKEEREALRKEHDVRCREFYVRRDASRQELDGLEKKIGELHRREGSHHRRIPVLGSELGEGKAM